MKNIVKFIGHRIARTFTYTGKPNLKRELLPDGDYSAPVIPEGFLRGLMQGSKQSADKILRHEFDILGQKLHLGANIDWELKNIEAAKADIKYPWELSRFQFLPTLIKAHETYSDEKYALEAKNLINDWMIKNPFGKGENWKNPMEAAIRACNFALAWHFFKNSKQSCFAEAKRYLLSKPFPPAGMSGLACWIDEKWNEKFLTSIIEHGKYIYNNLEYRWNASTNHLLADLTGLLILGILFPEIKDARKWKARAIHELEIEIQKQVYEDGVDFEASIPYHGLVCEMLGLCVLFGRENGIEFSQNFVEKLNGMFEFVYYYTKPNGLAPQIGDGDDGRFFIFENFFNREPRDHSHLLKLARELFPLNNLFIQSDREPTSRGFNVSRIYIMRKDDFYCIVDCGNTGQNGNGGHSHNDLLSFELSVGGEDFIVDPGTYTYTGNIAERKRFRGTAMHNTVMVDGQEINRFKSYTPFSIYEDAIPQINRWASNENHDALDAHHTGYGRLKDPILHQRFFMFDKKYLSLKITDIFTGGGEHKISWNFHFAPDVSLVLLGNKLCASKNGKKVDMIIPEELKKYAKICISEVSPRYGVKEKSKVLTINLEDFRSDENTFHFTILSA